MIAKIFTGQQWRNYGIFQVPRQKNRRRLSTNLKLYKLQLKKIVGGWWIKYSTNLKLYKLQLIEDNALAFLQYSTNLKLYKLQQLPLPEDAEEEYSTNLKLYKLQLYYLKLYKLQQPLDIDALAVVVYFLPEFPIEKAAVECILPA